ncbi:hypothetical protein J7L09_01680 [bacterium]|nr:hypothetical protein [bacterium]
MTSQLSLKQKSKIAFELHQKIKKIKDNIAVSYIYLAKYLKEIKEKKLYKYLSYNSFEEYLSSPELQISHTKAYDLIRIYTKYCEEFGVPLEEMTAHWTVIRETLPVVTKENYEEWLHRARELSRSDLKLEIKQLKSGIDPSKCEHDKHPEWWIHKEFWQCKKCGERTYVDPTKN